MKSTGNIISTILGWVLLYITIIMGALSPGPIDASNQPLPRHWNNNSTPTKLYSRTGHLVQALPDGTVKGTLEHVNPHFVHFRFIHRKQDKGFGSVVIQGVDTDRYLCMDRESVVYSTAIFNGMDCTWLELVLPNWYNAYQHRYHKKRRNKYYLGVNFNGTIRFGNMSRKTQRTAQFLRQEVTVGTENPPKQGPPIPIPPYRPSTSPKIVPTTPQLTKPTRRTKLGCKHLKTRYCRRIRRLFFQGKKIKHAKRHRKCRNVRRNKLKTQLSPKELRRLLRQCNRIQRKRQERRQQKVSPSPHRTS